MGDCPLYKQVFSQRGKNKDIKKFRFSVRLPTVHPEAVRCLLSDVSVGIPNKEVLIPLT